MLDRYRSPTDPISVSLPARSTGVNVIFNRFVDALDTSAWVPSKRPTPGHQLPQYPRPRTRSRTPARPGRRGMRLGNSYVLDRLRQLRPHVADGRCELHPTRHLFRHRWRTVARGVLKLRLPGHSIAHPHEFSIGHQQRVAIARFSPVVAEACKTMTVRRRAHRRERPGGQISLPGRDRRTAAPVSAARLLTAELDFTPVPIAAWAGRARLAGSAP